LAYIQLGDIEFQGTGDWDKAFDYYQKAEEIANSIANNWTLGYALWGLAEVYRKKGDLQKALTKFKEARSFFNLAGDEPKSQLMDRELKEITINQSMIEKEAPQGREDKTKNEFEKNLRKAFFSYADADTDEFKIQEIAEYLENQPGIEKVYYWKRDAQY
jgi:tetratricopeptide (TPR) repeat protein